MIASATRTPVEVAVFVRALFLAAGEGIAGLYLTLLAGDFFRFDLELTVFALAGAAAFLGWDLSQGKSLREPGLPTKIVTFCGTLAYARRAATLAAGLFEGREGFDLFGELLSDPFWFLAPGRVLARASALSAESLVNCFMPTLIALGIIGALASRNGGDQGAACSAPSTHRLAPARAEQRGLRAAIGWVNRDGH